MDEESACDCRMPHGMALRWTAEAAADIFGADDVYPLSEVCPRHLVC